MTKDEKIAALEDRVAELEELLGVGPTFSDQYAKLGLSPMERQVLGYIVRREVATKEGAFQAIYGARSECDQPDMMKEAISVRIYQVRNALDPHGIEIKTIYKVGWTMSEDDKKKLADLVAARTFGHYPKIKKIGSGKRG